MQRRFAKRFPKAGMFCLLLSATTLQAQEPVPEFQYQSLVPEKDPILVKPTSSQENFDAALLLVRLGRFELAKDYLQRSIDQYSSPEELLDLRLRVGTSTFLELSRLDELNPQATDLLKLVENAIHDQLQSPGYFDSILQRLNGSGRERAQATDELLHLGPPVIAPLLNSRNLSLPTQELVSLFTRFGADAIEPMIGALRSESSEHRQIAAEVLGRVGESQDTVWLWRTAFSNDEIPTVQQAARTAIARLKYQDASKVGRVTIDGAVNQILGSAQKILNGSYTWRNGQKFNDHFPVWTWDSSTQQLVLNRVDQPQAELFLAESLARDAAVLAPESEQATTLLLASLLIREQEKAETEANSDQESIQDLAVRLGPNANLQVLRFALDHDIPAASLGALNVLKLNGSARILSSSTGQRVMLDALNSTDLQVQFAAATTIAGWSPLKPFRGSQRVIEILARTLNSDQALTGIIADPNLDRANQTATYLRELGYETQVTGTGQEAFQLVAEQGNVAILILHPNVIRWELTQTLTNLKADSRTANVPVLIHGPRSIRHRFAQVQENYKNVFYTEEGQSSRDLFTEMEPHFVSLNSATQSPQIREAQIIEAAHWLRVIASRQESNVFDLAPAESALIRSIYKPKLVNDALLAVAVIPSSAIQRELLQVTSSVNIPVATRELAVQQLVNHIQRFGNLLPNEELTLLPALMNSETNPTLKKGYASAVGAIQPPAGAVRKELLNRPLSSAP